MLKLSLSIAFAAWIAVGAGARGIQPDSTRVCVVAVRNSGLFTMCPSGSLIRKWGYVGRTQSQEMIQNPEGPRLGLPQHVIQLDRPVLDRSRAEWWDIVGRVPGSSPSGVLDPDLKRDIEREFAGRSDYQIVDVPQKADLVFLAEGFYADASAGFVGAQPGRYRAAGRPLLAFVMAAAMPAAVYARFPSDADLLLQAARWTGAEAWKSSPPGIDRQPAAEPASIAGLVGQFAEPQGEKEKFPPLCAARTLMPSVDSQGKPRARIVLPDPAAALTTLPAINPGGASTDKVIKVDVSMVTVPVIISDAAGAHIPGLTSRDFHLFEDGAEQQVDRVIPEITPFNVVLMLDTSGSTLFKHTEIQNAALAFVETLRPDDRVMVVSFDSSIYLDSPFTTDRAALRRAILQTDTGPGTRLYDALDMVITECLSREEGRKAIVLFTDGIDTQSWLARFGNYREKVEESDALVYAVQYDTMVAAPASPYLLGLSENSGGRLFLASTMSSLATAFAEIAGELQHQYTICYYPDGSRREPGFRKIRVTVDTPGAKIRARTGYRLGDRSAKH